MIIISQVWLGIIIQRVNLKWDMKHTYIIGIY